MKDFNTYLKSPELTSKFSCELGTDGGFVNFKNSGARGGVKEFTVSLSSLLKGLNDIKSNLAQFSELTLYVEKSWRDAGSKYFQDLVLNSMITVQTKPCFTTLSKVISWANNEPESEFNDNKIDLSESSLETAITRIVDLMERYTPKSDVPTITTENKTILKNNKIRDFAYQIISTLFINEQTKLELLMSPKYPDNKVDLPYLPKIFLFSDIELQEDALTSGAADTLRFFKTPLIVNSRYIYVSTQWYGDERKGLSFENLKLFLKENFPKYQIIKDSNDFILQHNSKHTLSINKLSKPFLLLAGISGTGKSRFVRKQAENTGNGKENFELVSVRPDWHEPSDLLGYVSRLSSDGPQYVATPVLSFMVKAWLDIVESADKSGWQAKDHDQISPFWLCLDEMNLAPVEQYFADYLSVIETRKWDGKNYSCEPLLKKDIFEQLGDKAKDKLQKELGLENHPELWQYFLAHGIAIPFNLIVAGTVNMDETTHGFSRKVIDRALTFDFGEFFPNHLEDFFDATQKPKLLSYPIYSEAKLELFSEVPADPDADKTKKFFNSINSVLKDTPFELAFRAFNELCLSVISFTPKTSLELEAVFDDFLMCKVLPRIEGDDDKLLTNSGQNLLEALIELLTNELAEIWENERPDLLRNKLSSDDVITIPCRTKKKLVQMKQSLTRGFSSFWP